MKIHGIANILTGITFLIIGIGLIWFLIRIGVPLNQTISSLGDIAGDPSSTSQIMGVFSVIVNGAWTLSFVSLISGVVNIISGALHIKK